MAAALRLRLVVSIAPALLSCGAPADAGPIGDGTGGTTTSTSTTVDGTGTTTSTLGDTSSSGSIATSGSTSSGASSSDTGTGSQTGDTGVVVDWDCDALTEPFVSQQTLVNPRGQHDVAFDGDGRILGFDGASILAVTYDDEVTVWVPGVTAASGMDVLENGDLLYTDENLGALRRVSVLDQQTWTVATDLPAAYGITVGPDQQAYVATGYDVVRVDPETGDVELFVVLPQSVQPRGTVFNLDSTGVYVIAANSPGAAVYLVAVDENLDPTGATSVVALGVGFGYHDAIGIDACGNLYIADFYSWALYRVAPDGTVSTIYANVESGLYGHGLEWGSGLGGWNDRAIYLPLRFGGLLVSEMVLGVPSGSAVRTWNR